MLKSINPRRKPAELISASEIATFSYCTEQWRLQCGLELPPDNRVTLDAGTRHHHRKGAAEQLAGGLLAAGPLVAACGLVALLWLLWVNY